MLRIEAGLEEMTPQLSNGSQVSKNSIEKQYINLKKKRTGFFYICMGDLNVERRPSELARTEMAM